MQTIFVRHNLSHTPKMLQTLWDRRLIALHYDDITSTDPKDYSSSGQKALTTLWRACAEGALVGADFRRLTSEKMLVGKLRPQSKIFSEVFSDPARDISYIYKLAQLYDVREVRYIDYPLLMGVQPQHATITGWPSAEKVLEAALGGHSLPFFASSLHPAQLEVVCYEYLRENLLLDRLLMPIGRCMVDLDVLGFDGAGNRVLAQVTYETNAAKLKAKGEQLLNHATAGDRCYFFAPRKALPTFGPRVSVIAIEDALETLRASPSPSAKKMLERMFRGGLGQTLGIDKVRHDPRFSRRP